MGKPIAMTKFLFVISFLLFSSMLSGQHVTSIPFKSINSPYDEQALVLSPDGQTLYFTIANHPQNVGGKRDPGDIWVSTLLEGRWQTPIHAGSEINDAAYNAVAGFNADGSILFLLSHYGKNDQLATTQGISFSRKKLVSWSTPENISIPFFLNRSKHFSGMINKEETVFVFAAESYETKGGEDIYVSFKKNNQWSEAINLGATINTPAQEWTPTLSDDNQTLYFSSNGRKGLGSFDIYTSTRLDDSWTHWSTPLNMAEPLNSEARELYYRVHPSASVFTTTRDSDWYGNIFSSLDSAQVAKWDTTTLASNQHTEKPKNILKKIKLFGVISDSKSRMPINATLLFKADSLQQRKTFSIKGKYEIEISPNKVYYMEIQSPHYVNLSERLDIHANKSQTIEMNFKLQPIEVGTVIHLKNILFVVGTTTLLPESFPELDVVLDFLQSNPSVEILMEGHTDNRGDANANLVLSRRRVEVIKNYLVSKGISKKRIQGKGYGGAKPISTANDEEARKINRRVEFVILKD